MRPNQPLTVLCALLVLVPAIRAADEPAADSRIEGLKRIPLEELLVTSVSKKSEHLFGTAAAVAVITNEEIQRSGVRTIADALRLAPGMEVAHVSGNQWAVSTRGFNDRFAGKLLVLIDGRAVFNTVFNGVFWDSQDYLLEDIDRIEVIRGPGGTLYGANAVNGVINIITKSAEQTQGGYVNGGGGSQDTGFGAARWGQKLGENGFLRGYVKYDEHAAMNLGNGKAFDEWDTTRGGFRADWKRADNQFTLQGDYYYGHRAEQFVQATGTAPFQQTISSKYVVQGANTVFRWTRELADGGEVRFQTYWDHFARQSPLINYRADTFDLDFQHRFKPLARHELVYGVGYRVIPDQWKDSGNVVFDPASRSLQVASGFVQDEIMLVEDRLKLILGTKFEHNDYTGFEYEPSVRLAWTPTARQTVWTAFSRAVRTPSRTHEDLQANLVSGSFPIGTIRFTGNRAQESEELLSTELGYRIKPLDRLSFDTAAYYFVFDNVDSTVPTGLNFAGTTPPPAHPVLGITDGNGGRVHTYGFELGSDLEVQDWWRLRAGYNYFNYRHQFNTQFSNAATPRNQVFVRSSWDLGRDVAFDAWFRYRGGIGVYGLSPYSDVDLRLSWKPCKKVELSVVGQNLVRAQRRDFGVAPGTIAAPLSEVPRSVYGQMTMRF